MQRPGRPLDALALLRALSEHGVEFVVIGGFSLAANGIVRGTKDLDVVPDPALENLERLIAALRAIDAEPSALEDVRPEELRYELGVEGLSAGGNWLLDTRHGRLDIMQSVPAMDSYDRLREAALGVEIGGEGPYLFAGIDDLVAMKRAAGRPQDMIDIASLEQARR